MSSTQFYSDITETGFANIIETYFASLSGYIDGLLFNYKAAVTAVTDTVKRMRRLSERKLSGSGIVVYFQLQVISSQDYLPDDTTVASISTSLFSGSSAIASSLASTSGLTITSADIITIQHYNTTFLGNAHTPFPSGQPTAQPSSSPTSVPTAPIVIHSSISFGSLFLGIFIIVLGMFSAGEGYDRHSHHVEHKGKKAPTVRPAQTDRKSRYIAAMHAYINTVLSKNNRGIFSDMQLHSRIWYECLYNHCYLQLLHSPDATHWYRKGDQKHANEKSGYAWLLEYIRGIESTIASPVWTRFVYALQLYTNLAFVVTIICLLYITQYPVSGAATTCPSRGSMDACLQQHVDIFDEVALCQWDSLAKACTMSTHKYDFNLRVVYLISLVATIISAPVQTILAYVCELLLAPEPDSAYHNHLVECSRKAAIESLATKQAVSPRRSLGGNFTVTHDDDDHLDDDVVNTKAVGTHSPAVPPLIRQISSFNSSQRILHQYAYVDDDTPMPPAIYQDAKYLYLLELLVPSKLQESAQYISNSVKMIRATLEDEGEINSFDDEYGVITVGTGGANGYHEDAPKALGPETTNIENRLKYVIHSTSIYYKLMRLMRFSNATAGYHILFHFVCDLLEYNGGKLYKDMFTNKFQQDSGNHLAKTTEQLVYTKWHKCGVLLVLLVLNIGFVLVCYYATLGQPLELVTYWIASIGIYLLHAIAVYEIVVCLLLNVYLPLHAYEPVRHVRGILYHMVENYFHNPKPTATHGTRFSTYIQDNYFVSNGLAKLFTELLESQIIALYTSYRKQEHKLCLRDSALFDVIQQCNARLVSNENRTKIVVNLLVLSGSLSYKWQKLLLSVLYVCTLTLVTYLVALGSPVAAVVIHCLLAGFSMGALLYLIRSHSAVGLSRVVPAESPKKHTRKLVRVEVPHVEEHKSSEAATVVTPTPAARDVNIRQIRKRKVRNMWRQSVHKTIEQGKHKTHQEEMQQLWHASASRIQRQFKRMKARKAKHVRPATVAPTKPASSSSLLRRHDEENVKMVWNASAIRIQSHARKYLAMRLIRLMRQVEGVEDADEAAETGLKSSAKGSAKGSAKVATEPTESSSKSVLVKQDSTKAAAGPASMLSNKSASRLVLVKQASTKVAAEPAAVEALVKQASGNVKSPSTLSDKSTSESTLMKQNSGKVASTSKAAVTPANKSANKLMKQSSGAALEKSASKSPVYESVEPAPAPLMKKQTSILKSVRNLLFGEEVGDASQSSTSKGLFGSIKDSLMPNHNALRERLSAQQREIDMLKEAITSLSNGNPGTTTPAASNARPVQQTPVTASPVKHYDFESVDSDSDVSDLTDPFHEHAAQASSDQYSKYKGLKLDML